MKRRSILPVLVVAVALVSCGDPGFDVYFENPCDKQVEFVYAVVEPAGIDPILGQTILVAGGETVLLTPLTIEASGREVLVGVNGLAAYEERWPEPATNESRVFSFDRVLCDEVSP